MTTKTGLIVFISIFLIHSGRTGSRAENVQGRVVINEIYYDHPGTDGGREFIELYNGSSLAEDISQLQIIFVDGKSSSSRVVWTAPANTFLAPGNPISVCGDYYDPPPGYLLQGSLENGPDAVLIRIGEAVIDMIGYGDLLFPGLYEGSPAQDVEAGFSLSRRPDGEDSDNNRDDFVSASPTPGRRNFFSYDLGVSITGKSFLVCAGEYSILSFKIENKGLCKWETLTSIDLYYSRSGLTDRLEFDMNIPEGCAEIVEVDIPPLYANDKIDAVLDADCDENAVNDTADAVISVSPGPIVINEIMYRPLEDDPEWVELFNRSGRTLDLSGWCLADLSGSSGFIMETDVMVAPSGFLVIAEDPDLFESGHPDDRITVTGLDGRWPTLNDKGSGSIAEKLYLFDREGLLVEEIFYRDMMVSERGRSIERYNPGTCGSGDRIIWHRCGLTSGSTPGRQNSGFCATGEQERSLQVAPPVIEPLNEIYASISGVVSSGETGFSICIYNLDGTMIRRIFSESEGAKPFSCRWNGRTDSGDLVPTGLYICVAEFLGQGGRVCRREKRCVAVSCRR